MGNWTVKFNVPKLPNDSSAMLSVSLAGYSSDVSSSIVVNGSSSDASRKTRKEISTYPYPWFDNANYQSRGSVSGKLILSDGRPAAKAAVFLGDNNPNETTLDMGRYYYYTAYTDSTGNFEFKNVRTASYALQAWANGGAIGDVPTTFIKNDVVVSKKRLPSSGTSFGRLRNGGRYSKSVVSTGHH